MIQVINKTARLLPNLCFAAIIVSPSEWSYGRCGFYVHLTSDITKTKQRYIFLLTQAEDSSYLLVQPLYLWGFSGLEQKNNG
jgi:hypothetical protein